MSKETFEKELRFFLESKGIDNFIFITEQKNGKYTILTRVYTNTFLFDLKNELRRIFL